MTQSDQTNGPSDQLLQPTFPPGLPVSARVDDIAEAIRAHQVVIVAGETGSGKTTQLPKICLSLGRGTRRRIGHTQPRRLAARSVAFRIAEELGCEPGKEVGYQVRFSDHSSEATRIKLMTDGILLAEIQRDPQLKQYDTLIIDEAHERSLNIDFLLGYLKRLLPKRPDLKLIITSATIDVDRFSRHFNNAPVIEVSGRTYPVDILYRPPAEDDDEEDSELSTQVERAVREIMQLDRRQRLEHGDILVFLSGEKEIRDIAQSLRKLDLPDTEILPLYARLSSKEQNRIFSSHRGRRIVLSTNVAETSLTVPGIGYVIDSGLVRMSRYSVRSKIQRLPIEPVSQASARQRAGRCGRLGPGVCIRLYSEADYLSRPAFTDTEITRTHLGSVILQMLSLGLGDIESFPFLEPPDGRAIRDGFRLLEELGAINRGRRLSGLGRKMARLPVDPRLARIIMEASSQGCLREMLIIISALSIQDPRERPYDRQQAADQRHAQHAHPDSDFMAYVHLWDHYEVQRQRLTQNRLRRYCRDNFLAWMRMREWRELHRQLQLVAKDLGLTRSEEAAEYAFVHKALLSGLLSQVATRMEEGTYLGARNRHFRIFPGSVLSGKKPRWILSAELVETAQLFARMNARVEPEWIEEMAPSFLLKQEYLEPHWSKKRGRVMAWERISLYGLVLVERRLKPYSAVDPVESRAIFVREALVERQLRSNAAFYHANGQLIDRIRALEDKARRRDLLVDEQQIEAFYQERLPEEVLDQRSLERWYRKAKKQDPDCLILKESDLTRPEVDEVDPSQFPDQLQTASMALPLDYQFDPGRQADGVSVSVPVAALRQLRSADLDWLVPGMLEEKCLALVRALPKGLRKQFVPVPATVRRIMPQISKDQGDLKLQLVRGLKRISGVDVPPDSWADYEAPPHLRMLIRVLGDEGEELGSGRELRELQSRFAESIQASLARQSRETDNIERHDLKDWDFGALPVLHEVERGGITLKTYPALVDKGDSVALELFDSPNRARLASQGGVARLIMLRTPQQLGMLKKQALQDPRGAVTLRILGGRQAVLTDFIKAVYLDAFRLEEELPRDKEAFESLLEQGRSRIIERGERLEKLLQEIMALQYEIRKTFKGQGLAMLELQKDIEAQLQALIHERFLETTPLAQLHEFPRYLKAIQQRIERFPLQPGRDRAFAAELAAFWHRYEERASYCRAHDIRDEAVEQFRWMLEEYRVSLFAQQLGTRQPVSAKRLEKCWLAVGRK